MSLEGKKGARKEHERSMKGYDSEYIQWIEGNEATIFRGTTVFFRSQASGLGQSVRAQEKAKKESWKL